MASWTRTGVAGAIVACILSGLAATSAQASRIEQRVLAEINDLRAAHGLGALRSSRSLAGSADRYAEHILRTDRPHHHRHIWASDRFDLAGEAIAWEPGSGRDAEDVVARWAASEPHRRLLLDDRFTWGGIGREYGTLDDRRTTVWVLHVGRK